MQWVGICVFVLAFRVLAAKDPMGFDLDHPINLLVLVISAQIVRLPGRQHASQCLCYCLRMSMILLGVSV